MDRIQPASAAEMAAALREYAEQGNRIRLEGNGSKRGMAGPIVEADVTVTTAGLKRVLQYEPGDLTVSVEAGLGFEELQKILQERGQMIALDPPFAKVSTVGGVVAANVSGPMRRGFGTARDLIIGMEFAMLDGRLVKSGGMVVKNVAGLDMAKPLIGSFGTLAAITRVNFRLHPLPEGTTTFLYRYSDLSEALAKRDAIRHSVLQPFAMDLLSPEAAGGAGYLLALRAGGSAAVLARYRRELSDGEAIEDQEEELFWSRVREFSFEFLKNNPAGVVLRISVTLTQLADVMREIAGKAVARAGTGVVYAFFDSWERAREAYQGARAKNWTTVVEFAPDDVRKSEELWPAAAGEAAANGFDMMKKVKEMFDPGHLLNRSRLYGRI
jgi:glycolate oxidase FAD binding subunit